MRRGLATLPDQIRLLEHTRIVHGELERCYNQSRIDERDAALNDVILRKKLRYGAYPPELRTVFSKGKPAEAADADGDGDEDEDDRAAAEAKLRAAERACPRAANARNILWREVNAPGR